MKWPFQKQCSEEIEEARRESDKARELLRDARQAANEVHNRLMEQTLRGHIE